jgi:uncharacterized protein YcfL
MSKNKLLFYGAGVIVVFILCGCVFRPMSGGSNSLELKNSVVFKDAKTYAQIRVQQVNKSFINDLLQAGVVLKNLTNIRINLEIRVKFRDKDGLELDDLVGWIPFPIESSELKTFKRIATSSRAVDFVIMVQMAGGE